MATGAGKLGLRMAAFPFIGESRDLGWLQRVVPIWVGSAVLARLVILSCICGSCDRWTLDHFVVVQVRLIVTWSYSSPPCGGRFAFATPGSQPHGCTLRCPRRLLAAPSYLCVRSRRLLMVVCCFVRSFGPVPSICAFFCVVFVQLDCLNEIGRCRSYCPSLGDNFGNIYTAWRHLPTLLIRLPR